MLRHIINCFKLIKLFLTKTGIVVDHANKNLDQAADSMAKRRRISKDKSLQEYKKQRAQMVIDGNYDSEEAMDKDLAEIEAQVLGKK